MDETVFKSAVAAISSGEYDDSDVKAVKEQLNSLNQKELSIKKEIEKSTHEFVKNKNKSYLQLKTIRSNIKQLQNILKTV